MSLIASTVLWFLVFYAIAIDHTKLESTMLTKYGVSGKEKLILWEHLLATNAGQPDLEKIKQVNRFFNQSMRFEEDASHWHQSDYWATPLESLGSGAGDCEDYAIAKYMTLLQLGFSTDSLRLIYVKAQIGGEYSRVFQAHMVLGYYQTPSSIPLILDSLVSDIESADKRSDLHPVFSFNSDGLWVGNTPQPQIDPTARLSRWRDVLDRMKAEGF